MHWRIERRAAVTSTMDVAARLAAGGAAAGTVVVADEQTAGRGRLGRVWTAPPGGCLLFTTILRPPLPAIQSPDLARRVAERVADAVAEVAGVEPRVKDPNDVMLGTRKLAGVLLHTSVRGQLLEYLLVGVGVNVNVEAEDLPLPTATSLLVATGRRIDREALLRAILRRFEEMGALMADAGIGCPSPAEPRGCPFPGRATTES